MLDTIWSRRDMVITCWRTSFGFISIRSHVSSGREERSKSRFGDSFCRNWFQDGKIYFQSYTRSGIHRQLQISLKIFEYGLHTMVVRWSLIEIYLMLSHHILLQQIMFSQMWKNWKFSKLKMKLKLLKWIRKNGTRIKILFKMNWLGTGLQYQTEIFDNFIRSLDLANLKFNWPEWCRDSVAEWYKPRMKLPRFQNSDLRGSDPAGSNKFEAAI